MEADRVTVQAYDGKRLPATVVAYHGESGFVLLRVEAGLDVEPLRLGDASKLSAKDPVLIVAYGGPAAVRPALVVSKRTFAGPWEYLIEGAIYTAPLQDRKSTRLNSSH